MRRRPLIVVMGVAGSGKSLVGAALAESLNVTFVDADNLHPASNVAKMASGIPLDDDDRWPWLDLVGDTLAEASGGLVMACSALRRAYRDRILRRAPDTQFVLLDGTRELLTERIGGRENHFMPTTLLDSQLATLEPLDDDEPGFVVDIDTTAEEIVSAIERRLG